MGGFRRRSSMGDLERAILDVLWDGEHGPRTDDEWLTVRAVHSDLEASREAAYTTVMTVMDRMARKGLLGRRKVGRAYEYRPLNTRAEITVEFMRAALGEFSDARRSDALLAFVKHSGTDDRQALRHALEQLEAAEERSDAGEN